MNETDIANLQSALIAAGHTADCPVVHAASVDCVPGGECVDWRSCAEKAEAERDDLKRQLDEAQAELAKLRSMAPYVQDSGHYCLGMTKARNHAQVAIVEVTGLKRQLAECQAEIGKEQERGDRWRKLAAQYRIKRGILQADVERLRALLQRARGYVIGPPPESPLHGKSMADDFRQEIDDALTGRAPGSTTEAFTPEEMAVVLTKVLDAMQSEWNERNIDG